MAFPSHGIRHGKFISKEVQSVNRMSPNTLTESKLREYQSSSIYDLYIFATELISS